MLLAHEGINVSLHVCLNQRQLQIELQMILSHYLSYLWMPQLYQNNNSEAEVAQTVAVAVARSKSEREREKGNSSS
jgi:hypothetical protein